MAAEAGETPEKPEKIVFVGGAPRSGTTVTHALICTSARVSVYSREISFLRGITQAYRNGRLAWDDHTSDFFETPEAFRAHMRRTADLTLGHVWRHLGRPPILALKDPHLTPFFPDIRHLYPDIAAFVTVMRHPYDVVRSRLEVQERRIPGRISTAQDAEAIAGEYLRYYQAVLTTNFLGRHMMFRYEDLNSPMVQTQLAQFIGVGDLHARPLWGKSQDQRPDPWGSPKYQQPIDVSPRLSPLAPSLAQAVQRVCGALMERFGYT
jgi:hypothetical protein